MDERGRGPDGPGGPDGANAAAGAGDAGHKGYWRDVLKLTGALLAIWFAVSFGAGILFREFLDQFSLGGAPLGFWFAQNGSIYVFVGLIFYYCFAMARIERKHRIEG